MEEYLGFDNGAETHERTVNIAVVDWRETIQKTCVRMLIHPEGINVENNKCRKNSENDTSPSE